MPRGKAATTKAAAPKMSASEKALADFDAKFTKTYGAGVMMAAEDIPPYQILPTGSLMLDDALGVGGLVVGRLHEWWGQDGIGKSTMAMITMAQAQRTFPDKLVAWIDAEHKADIPWMEAHGIDTARNRFRIIDPSNAEEVADQVKDLGRSKLFSLIVLDSIGSMIPEAEKEKDSDQAVVALQAKRVTRMVKIAASESPRTGTTLLMINQVRANVGGYGKATMTGGGWALRHGTTSKLEFKRTGKEVYKANIAGQQVQVGHEMAIKVERNGVAPAYRTAFVSLFNQPTEKYGPLGIDRASEATLLGIKYGIVDANGAWYTLPVTAERVQGQDKVVEAMRADPSLIDHVREQILLVNRSEIFTEEKTDTGEPELEFITGDPNE